MYYSAEIKKEIFKKFGKTELDSGTPEVQIALFTFRINHLTEHLKKNKHDNVTRRSLVRMVGKRRSLLDYLIKNDIARYRVVIKELGIRK
ncbi:MAG: 30S ribosomal protein S15 [Bacteroidales bacterium]|nr:30S ribosomal protein S15 [Bacteroidales bacterium]